MNFHSNAAQNLNFEILFCHQNHFILEILELTFNVGIIIFNIAKFKFWQETAMLVLTSSQKYYDLSTTSAS